MKERDTPKLSVYDIPFPVHTFNELSTRPDKTKARNPEQHSPQSVTAQPLTLTAKHVPLTPQCPTRNASQAKPHLH